MRAKMMDIHKGAQDKIRAILTDDQKTKYDALQAEMQERMKERRQGGGPPPPPSAIAAKNENQDWRRMAGGKHILRPSCVWVPTDGGLCGYNEGTVTKALRNSGRRVACGTAHDVTDEFEGI